MRLPGFDASDTSTADATSTRAPRVEEKLCTGAVRQRRHRRPVRSRSNPMSAHGGLPSGAKNGHRPPASASRPAPQPKRSGGKRDRALFL